MNQGGSSDKDKNSVTHNNQTQNLNFVDVNSEHSAKSVGS